MFHILDFISGLFCGDIKPLFFSIYLLLLTLTQSLMVAFIIGSCCLHLHFVSLCCLNLFMPVPLCSLVSQMFSVAFTSSFITCCLNLNGCSLQCPGFLFLSVLPRFPDYFQLLCSLVFLLLADDLMPLSCGCTQCIQHPMHSISCVMVVYFLCL